MVPGNKILQGILSNHVLGYCCAMFYADVVKHSMGLQSVSKNAKLKNFDLRKL